MKELSIEEKAKAYDKALERAKMSYHTGDYNKDTLEMLEIIFPELKESEDERIRKEIIEAIKGRMVVLHPEKCIAWLEKQGEHAKFYESIQVGDKVTRNEDGMLVNLSQLKRVSKPAEEYNITGIGSKNAQGKLGEMIKNLKPINEVLEQNPAWSEEDEEVIHCLEYTVRHFYEDEDTIKWCCDWLKSLRPQNRWKPSEEQMEILDMVLTNEAMDDNIARILRELREQLKKLMEEKL